MRILFKDIKRKIIKKDKMYRVMVFGLKSAPGKFAL
jgi:hypothetical protein